jgi:hypothetical protein
VCDKGNLRQAMRRGLLHKRTANKGLVVDMRLLVTVTRMQNDQRRHSMFLMDRFLLVVVLTVSTRHLLNKCLVGDMRLLVMVRHFSFRCSLQQSGAELWWLWWRH